MVESFGAQGVDFAQVVKIYKNTPEGEIRYSPSTYVRSMKVSVFGNPDLKSVHFPCGAPELDGSHDNAPNDTFDQCF